MAKFEFYRDRKREWRWRVTASNGKRIAASSEGYKRLHGALKNASTVSTAMVFTNMMYAYGAAKDKR